MLSRDTGSGRDYGSNPYAGYDDPDSQPFLLGRNADQILDRVRTLLNNPPERPRREAGPEASN